MKEVLYLLATKITTGDVGIPKVGANAVLSGVLNIVYIVAGVVAVVVIVVSGLMYIASNGDSNRIQAAKNALLYSIIGLVVVVMAFAITGFVIGGVK